MIDCKVAELKARLECFRWMAFISDMTDFVAATGIIIVIVVIDTTNMHALLWSSLKQRMKPFVSISAPGMESFWEMNGLPLLFCASAPCVQVSALWNYL